MKAEDLSGYTFSKDCIQAILSWGKVGENISFFSFLDFQNI